MILLDTVLLTIDFIWAFSEVPDVRTCKGLYFSSFPGFSRVKQEMGSFSPLQTEPKSAGLNF